MQYPKFYLFFCLLLLCGGLVTTGAFAQPSGSALAFDGESQFVFAEDHPSLDLTDEFTIAAWIYIEDYVEWASIVTKGVGENNYTIHQTGPAGGTDFGRLRFTGDSPNLPLFLESNTVIPLGEWHYVAITYDGTTLTFYYDGQPDGGGALPGPLAPNDEPLVIAADFPGGLEFWNGALDEIRIWNVALQPAHVRAAMNGQAAPRANRLAAYWRFDEGSGETADDRSENNNTGYLIGEPTWISPGAPIGGASLSNPSDMLAARPDFVVPDLQLMNFPNPFAGRTTMLYFLPHHDRATLAIYDQQGRLVRTLVRADHTAGQYSVSWDGSDQAGRPLASGLYYAHLSIGDGPPVVRKLILQH